MSRLVVVLALLAAAAIAVMVWFGREFGNSDGFGPRWPCEPPDDERWVGV